MNLLLFAPHEIDPPLPRTDPRARHLIDVLRRRVGDEFDAGLVNGPRGKGRLVALDPDTLTLAFDWTTPPPVADAVTLLLGLPRPQTARDILRDATTLGVAALHFVATEKSEASYASSSLWRDDEWRRHVLAGAEQAFSTQIPVVQHGAALAAALTKLPPDAQLIALDNYEAPRSLHEYGVIRHIPLVLALGPERGWGARDRSALRAAGFEFAHLGSRVLRLESAVLVALALAKAARGTL